MQVDHLKEMTPVFYNQYGIKSFSRAIHFPLHWHDRFELIYVVRGELQVTIDKKDHIAKANELIILAPRALHSGKKNRPETAYCTIMFEPYLFSSNMPAVKKFIEGLLQKQIHLTPITSDKEIIDLFLKIFNEQTEQGDVVPLHVAAHLHTLLALLRERCLLDMQADFSDKKSINEIIFYIQENYQQPLTSSFLCKKFGYSQNHFTRLFVAETGISPTAFIRAVRLENAAEMLRETDIPITSIALDCGFPNISYFTRRFRELYGITPGQFRTTNRTLKE